MYPAPELCAVVNDNTLNAYRATKNQRTTHANPLTWIRPRSAYTLCKCGSVLPDPGPSAA